MPTHVIHGRGRPLALSPSRMLAGVSSAALTTSARNQLETHRRLAELGESAHNLTVARCSPYGGKYVLHLEDIIVRLHLRQRSLDCGVDTNWNGVLSSPRVANLSPLAERMKEWKST